MALIGRALLIMALGVAVFGIARIDLRRAYRPRANFVVAGRRSVYALAGLATLAFVILEDAFVRSDFAFNVVAEHFVSPTTPTFYRGRGDGPHRKARSSSGCSCCRCGRA